MSQTGCYITESESGPGHFVAAVRGPKMRSLMAFCYELFATTCRGKKMPTCDMNFSLRWERDISRYWGGVRNPGPWRRVYEASVIFGWRVE